MGKMLLVVLFSTSLCAQTFQLAAAAPSALGASAAISDVRITGTASWHMGSDEDYGTATLKATRDGKSRIDLQLGKKTLSEVRINDRVDPHLFVFDGSKWTEGAIHNAWVDANWFLPSFSTAGIAPERGFLLTNNGKGRYRSQFTILNQTPKATQLIQLLSIADFQIDSTTGLVTSMKWVAHPDEDYNISIPVEIRYSDYRNVNGLKVPHHIERFYNGTLQLDITVSSVAVNPGLSSTDFLPVVE